MDNNTNPANTAREIEPGDTVQVESGEFNGCILTVLRVERAAFVLRRSTEPREVRARNVSLLRKGRREWAA